MESIIGNLDKAKLKLDEAFFYLDEIEELVQEGELSAEAGSRVSQATERLTTELSGLGGRVAELKDILAALDQSGAGGQGEAGGQDKARTDAPSSLSAEDGPAASE